MTSDLSRWVVFVVVIASIVGLLIWARGEVHHHGRYIGAQGTAPISAGLES